MASVDLEYNQGFKIYKGNTWFNNLVLHKATYETVVMSLGDKISGIVYYKNNKLVVDMTEYIMYKDVKYVLVNPPTVIKEGLVSDNGELKGMTKYSFTFYHPMYMLSNFPFSDVAVDNSQKKYLSQNKTFSWIGNLTDYVAKLNKNLEGTQWKVSIGTNVTDAEKNKPSEVLSFDNNTIADALKTAYETWEIPYVIDQTYEGNKRFLVRFGLPNNEIYEKDKNGNFILDDNNQKIPFVFKYGQGVGLKNNSRTPKNNKIVTRIAGYGSEDNIPYGYPQIVWTGNQSWNYTINNDSTAANSYPIYDGIVGGQKVRLIKHPFTRTHLMPPIYSETVNKKVNPNATGYNPNIELVDYYDANDNTYPNQIKAGEPSYEIHEFEDIKPEFDSSDISGIDSATPYDGHSDESITQDKFLSIVDDLYTETDINAEKAQLNALRTGFVRNTTKSGKGTSGNYEYDWWWKEDGLSYKKVKYASSGANFEYVVNVGLTPATIDWDDTMDEQGNYVQSYFKVTIPALGFDLYASAAITQEMTINMRSGACIGCSFPVMVDWDDYKRNFYDKDGNFAPTGTQRNLTKYPNSTNSSITLILQKETNTFGTLMPNIYQKPASGDKFVILGISLPTSYITTAEGKLETEMKKYMRDNNVYYYEYPLKFDEHFLISNEHILSQMKPNVIVNFEYADVEQSLYIKQMSIKYNESPLPKYDITLTDDVDVVLNKIGEAIAEYRGQRQYENGGGNSETLDGNKFLRKDINDTASGTIRMLKGLQVGERFVTGLLGEGGIFRKDDDGTTYLECDRMYVRMKAYFDTVEVRRFLHSGGNRIASAAGIKCSRVEYIASNGLATQNVNNAVKFRCYFRAEDNGAKVTNDFVVGDLAYCKETNIDTNLSQHGYWRAVIGVSSNANSSGEHWIDLSKSDCSSTLNDVPIAQDDIIQLGNKTDKTRQGAIVEYVSGEDAPSYQIYQGINTYSLDNKNYIGLGYSSETNRAYMNVYGDMFVGVKPDAITGKSPTYIKYVQDDGTEQHNPKLTIKGIVEMLSPDDPEETITLDDFAKAITGDIEYLQQQIDGEIDTWFYDGVPTLNNYPASDWTTDNQKKEHLGDLYYDKLNGNAYRFIYDKDDETYSWLLLGDSAILEALRIANEAKDTADNKRRVFLTDAQHPHPTPPYDEGDLWVNAIWPSSGEHQGETYNDEILKCIKPVPRKEGGSDVTEFSIGDWSAANGYKTALSDFINNTYASFVTNIQTQVDRKAQTWYLGFDPSYSWAGNEKQHVGDLWYCTDDIENTNYKKNTTWIYQEGIDPNTGETIYYWAEAAVPDEVFDMIDGKSAIYTEWEAWIDESGASSLQVRDLLIPAADIVRGNVTYKQNKVYRCTNRNTQNPVFEEIAYTDDSAFNKYITQILNGTTETTDSAIVANALNAITTAITKAPATTIDGGLVLTSLIGMRDANSKVWAGISGLYKATESVTGQYKGHGIASWYGGGMADWEVYKESHPTATINDTYAKSLFRFDGSGYLAGGNITWDKNGIVTIANVYANIGGTNTLLTGTLQTLTNLSNALPLSLQSGVTYLDPKYSFTNLSVFGKEVATKEFVSNNYVPLAFFNALFSAFSTASPTSSTTPIDPSTWTASTVINNLKIKVGTWTEQYLSALGNNPNASGGGGISDLSAVLNELNSKNDLGTGVLVRNGLNNWSWMPYNAGTSGIDENAMWIALDTNINVKKIPQSHLDIDLSQYALGLLTAASLGESGNNTTLSITVGGTTKTGSVTVPYSTKSSYPDGFTSRNATNDWSGVTGTLVTDWFVNGADIMFKYDESKLNVITDGRFYQGIDIYGSTKRVLDEYDITHTKWGDADAVDGFHEDSFFRYRGSIDANYVDLTTYTPFATNYQNPKNGIWIVERHGYSGGLITFTGDGSASGLDLYFHYAKGYDFKFRRRIDSNRLSGDWETFITSENIGSQSVDHASSAGNADTVDDLHASSFLRKDIDQTTSCHYTFSKTNDDAIQVGTIRGYAVGSQSGEYIHLYERVHIGSPNGWGSQNAPSYGLSTYGGAWLATYSGEVGIGTVTPQYKLDVNGNIRATLTSWFPALELFGEGSGHIPYIDFHKGGDATVDYTSRIAEYDAGILTVAAKTGITGLVVGSEKADDYIKIGGAKLRWTGTALECDKDFYSTGAVSALGSQSSGGQDSFNADLMWKELGTNSTAKLIPQSHLNLSGYALTNDVTKNLTIKQTGKADVVYNGTEAKTITISAGTEVKEINDGTGTSFTDVLANQDGTFFFKGSNLINGQYDWVGIQVENKSGNTMLDKGQLVWSDGTLLTRQNDGGGWAQWATVLTDKNLPTASSSVLGGVKVNGNGLKMDGGVLKVDDLSGTYVTLSTAQTITGVKTFNSAIGVVGGLTPIAAGQVNTVSGYDRLWIKKAQRPDGSSQNDGTPNNGIVFEYGGGNWVGRLYMGDNGKEGLYFGGVYSGTIQEWTKLAFVSDNVASAEKLNDTVTRKFWNQTYWQNGNPVSSDVTGALSGNGDITITKTTNNIAVKLIGNSYQFGLHLGSGGTNRGIYDFTSGIDKWLVYFNASNTVLNYGNVGIGNDSPSYKLDVSGTFHASGDSSIGGKLLVGASSTNFRMHVMGDIVAEYDSTYKGSFRSVRGGYMGSFGVNASGYTVFVTSDGDGNNGTSIMSLTPYNATDKYALFPHNVRVGYGNAIAVSGAYVQIGGAKLIWDGSALKCDKDFYSTGAVSALGSNTSGGGGGISDISVSASLSGTLLTINVSGQTGSVDLSSISGTSGNYIPLSGSNAITGDLKPAYNDAKDLGNSQGNRWRQIHGKNFVGETIELSGVASVKSLRTTNVLIESNLNNGYLSNEINNFTNHLYLQYSTSKGLSLCYGGGSVAIGDTPGSFKFKVNGTSKFTDNVGIATDPDDDSDIRLKVDGDIKALSFIPMSDIRKKDIVDYVIINRIEDIARTPIFNFTWKNREKKTLHLGTSAQYIQDIFPNAVTHFSDGDIGLDYGATALAAAVFTARKVVDHELRIKQLEQENAILRKEIEELKAA